MANQLQEQVSTVWNRTSAAQRITLIALVLAVVAIIVVLIGWAQKPSYQVAYTGLSDSDASAITKQMDQQGISYQLQGTGTILVPSDQVYSARLAMASAGLPESSTVGYEIFSNNNVLGMTDFAQQVNYQRALEGELERTIGSLESVDSVRVNVVTPDKTLLSSDQAPTTASVMIKVKAGDTLTAEQVKAITHLVAYSVEGLKPENVVVVDADGNLLANGSNSDQEALTAQSDSQRAAEIAAATDIRNKVQSLLDTILGPNRSAVQANVVMDWSQKEVTSNIYDPTQVALLSSQRTSEGQSGTGVQASGVPGATSNLPTPSVTATAVSSTNVTNQSSETNNYDVSQTQTHEVYPTGQIKSISLAVMVDKVTDSSQLDLIKSAVSAAAGIDTSRGDTISVNTMEFDRSYYQTQATAMNQDNQNALYEKIGIGVGAAVLLIVLFIYFSKLIKNIRNASSAAWKPMQISAGGSVPLQLASATETARLNSPAGGQGQSSLADAAKRKDSKDSNGRNAPGGKLYPEDEQRERVISRLTEESPATVAEIIQIWLSEDDKNHG
jgi:flagellar M-ring protein FliF